MKTVVVTGVSTGIGRATAEVLIGQGLHVFGSLRTQADAARLEQELGPHFTALVFDITDPMAVGEAAGTVRTALNGEPLFGLVANAGIAVPGPLLHLRIDDFRRQLEVNLTGQLIVIQAFVPLLDATGPGLPGRSSEGAKPGRVVMMSSVSGKNASPFLGPYAVSKFGLEGFSESLRRELMVFGIDVIVIAPGAIATPIWDKADAVDISSYAGTVYAAPLRTTKEKMVDLGRKGLPAEKIGQAIWRALSDPHPKTRYEISPQPLTAFALKLLPKRWADRLYAKALGLNHHP